MCRIYGEDEISIFNILSFGYQMLDESAIDATVMWECVYLGPRVYHAKALAAGLLECMEAQREGQIEGALSH